MSVDASSSPSLALSQHAVLHMQEEPIPLNPNVPSSSTPAHSPCDTPEGKVYGGGHWAPPLPRTLSSNRISNGHPGSEAPHQQVGNCQTGPRWQPQPIS